MACARSTVVLGCAFAVLLLAAVSCRHGAAGGAEGRRAWPQAGRDAGRTALAPAAGPEEPRIVWSWELPSEEGADAYSGPAIVGGPVVAADGTAYVVSDGEQGGLWAVGPDGALRWRLPFGQVDWRRGERRLALDADDRPVVLVGGRLLRMHPCGAIEAAPSVTGCDLLLSPEGTAYVDGSPAAPAPADDAPPPDGAAASGARAAMAPDGTIYADQSAGDAASGGPRTSVLRASSKDGAERFKTELEGAAEALAVGSDGVLRVSFGRSVAAFGKDGGELWRFTAPHPFEGGMALGPDGKTHAAVNDHVYALDRKGRIAWERPFTTSGIGAGALVVDPSGSLYVRLSHQVFAANARGRLKWVVPFPDVEEDSVGFSSPERTATDLAMTGSGRLYACSGRCLYAIE